MLCPRIGRRVFGIVRRGADWQGAQMSGPGTLRSSGSF